MKRLQLFLAAASYVAVLLWAYATIVAPTFFYDGYNLKWPGVTVVAWSILVSLLPVAVLPVSFSRPSVLIVWWLYLAAYVPSILIPPLSVAMPYEQLMLLQMYLLLCMVIMSWVPMAPQLLSISRIDLNPAVFWSGFLLLWVGSLTFLCMHGRGSMLVLNFASLFASGDEYAVRRAFVDELIQTGRSLGYVIGQLNQALNPFLMAFGIVFRRKVCLVAGIAGQIIAFGFTAQKSVLFSILFLAALFYIMKRWRSSFGLVLTSGLTAIILLTAAVDLGTHNNFALSSLVARRTLATPGLLTGFYFEHFSQVAHAGMGFHFSRWAPPYFGPPQEIGLAYFGAEVDANANMWAEGFAEFGVLGIFGLTLLTASLIWIYDSISAKRNLALAALLAAMPALNLSNTTPTTVLFTHGAIAVAVLLYFSPRGLDLPERDIELPRLVIGSKQLATA